MAVTIMNQLQKTHFERILHHALNLKGLSGCDNELKSQAAEVLRVQGVKALLLMLQERIDQLELKSNVIHLTANLEDKGAGDYHSADYGGGIVNCIIDISDVINFFLAGHKTVSGIQRLVIATLASIPKETRSSNILISMHDYEKYGGWIIPWRLVDLLVEYTAGEKEESIFLLDIEILISSCKPVDLLQAKDIPSTLLIMGAAWIVPGFPRAHRDLARKYELKTISVLYDLIPYTYPDFVSADASREFYFYINSLLSISDGLISISRYVSSDLAKHRDSLGQSLIRFPVNLCAELAREIPFKVQGVDRMVLGKSMREKLIDSGVDVNNFILNVGSVEIRKNHIGLFVAWRHILATLGANCPQLVVVGRPGWKAESFIEALKSTNNLDGKVIVLHGIDDAVLSYLYENCKLTVYPSLEEGWGLPIGESLDAGKLCVTSNRASMPEVGRELCRYVDPTEPLTIAKEVMLLIEKPMIIKHAEKAIAAAKPLKNWLTYQMEIARLVNEVHKERPNPVSSMAASNWLIKSGQVCSFYWHLGGDTYDMPEALSGKKRSLHGSFPSRLLSSNLEPFESDGAWCKEPRLNFDFYIDIRTRKSNSFSIALHYYFHHTIAPIADIGLNAKLLILEDAALVSPDATADIIKPKLIESYLKAEVRFAASDLVIFNFDNVEILRSKEDNFDERSADANCLVPVNIQINWMKGFEFICGAGRTLEPLKIKEIRVDY